MGAARPTDLQLGEYRLDHFSVGERLEVKHRVLVEAGRRAPLEMGEQGSTLGVQDVGGEQPVQTASTKHSRRKQGGSTPSTPEASMGHYFKHYPDKQSTSVNSNVVILATTGPDTTPDPTARPVQSKKMQCSYTGNICALHGKGAKLKWRPAKGRTVGGKQREYFYTCDVGAQNKRLIQPSLPSSLIRRTMKEFQDTGDAMLSTSTHTTAGQGGTDVQTEGWN